jgi:hypothetical protein
VAIDCVASGQARVEPDDDGAADVVRIRAFHAPFSGRNPDQFDAR